MTLQASNRSAVPACTLALLMALGWMLPNLSRPWPHFNHEAWVAVAAALLTGYLLPRLAKQVAWHGLHLGAALLACVPVVQHFTGLLPFAGQAWINSAYVAGFCLCLVFGTASEKAKPDELADILFLAVLVAAVVSVGLQLCQWLALSEHDAVAAWVLPLPGSRPYANLMQPNQLATLQLWGLLACGWWVTRGKLSRFGAAMLALVLVLGIALTQSRTALLCLLVLSGFGWYWRPLWRSAYLVRVVIVAAVLYVLVTVGSEPLSHFLLLDKAQDMGQRTSNEVRLHIWHMLLEAAALKPLAGYGWSQIPAAQMAVIADHPALGNLLLGHAHNLFLDLVVWNGLPIGLLASGGLLWWFWLRLKAVTHAKDALLLLVIVAIGVHAMLELPLHYAYFLLVAGLVMGILDARLGGVPLFQCARVLLVALWLCASLVLGLLVRDYFHIAQSYSALRIEAARVGPRLTDPLPDTLLLDQFNDMFRMFRIDRKTRITEQELAYMRNVARTYPSLSLQMTLAAGLAMNGHDEEAKFWLDRVCAWGQPSNCTLAATDWVERQIHFPELKRIVWPGASVQHLKSAEADPFSLDNLYLSVHGRGRDTKLMPADPPSLGMQPKAPLPTP